MAKLKSAAKQRRIGVRELKSRLSECLREVKAGQTIVVTERGRRVAQIVPEFSSLQERMEALRKAGLLLWSGRRLRPRKPVARVHGKRNVADLISENRE